ncbi:MAG: hypothetical protein MMC23_000612 [Stictis urceolatum]|nr:hypothetical protein [Stictis urceolata]
MSSSTSPPPVIRLLLDARTSFPYPATPTRQPVSIWSSHPSTRSALSLLPSAEQTRVTKYYFPKDAALSLASFLLKHLGIVRCAQISWADSTIRQEKTTQNGKPYYEKGGLEFNVSHHGEAAVLIATSQQNVKVGIDLVQVDMEKDLKSVRSQGWTAYVTIFKEVFSDIEVRTILLSIPGAGAPMTDQTIVKGLRCFYAHWALKEAYFKMTGDALLADWLQQLEFGGVEPPAPADRDILIDDKWAWGTVSTATATLRGKNVEGVYLELRALGEHYMVATAVEGTAELPTFEKVEVEKDIMPLAKA